MRKPARIAAFALFAQAALAQPAFARTFIVSPVPVTPVAQWFHTDDYPPASMRGGEEGDVSVLLSVDPQGKVSDCRVTHSSGFTHLDQATCALSIRRGLFTPAKDLKRQPTKGSYVISNLKWRIAGIEAPTSGPPIEDISAPATPPAS